jgi:hypothetical protein
MERTPTPGDSDLLARVEEALDTVLRAGPDLPATLKAMDEDVANSLRKIAPGLRELVDREELVLEAEAFANGQQFHRITTYGLWQFQVPMEGTRDRGLPLADDICRLYDRLDGALYQCYPDEPGEFHNYRFMELVAEAWRTRGSTTRPT